MAMWAEEGREGREGKCALAVFNICSGEKGREREWNRMRAAAWLPLARTLLSYALNTQASEHGVVLVACGVGYARRCFFKIASTLCKVTQHRFISVLRWLAAPFLNVFPL